MFKREKQKGITLISLVITIIILLILAAVVINLAVDSDGLFEKAGEATNMWNTSVAEEGSTLNDIIGQIDNYIPLDWDAILADATTNPNKYKHPDQRSTNGDIGIGTDGKPVNLDLWIYDIINTNEIKLCETGGYGDAPGYKDNDITEDGRIQGTVPQYIKKDGQTAFYPVTAMSSTFMDCANLVTAPVIPDTVTNMDNTFYGCTNLITAPVIPNGVISMDYTFSGCTNLETAPVIPNDVISMDGTFGDCTKLITAPELPSSVEGITGLFSGCTNLTTPPKVIPSSVNFMVGVFSNCSKLTGRIEINAANVNSDYLKDFFSGAATAEGTNLIVTGSSPKLDKIIATKSTNSNITKGT